MQNILIYQIRIRNERNAMFASIYFESDCNFRSFVFDSTLNQSNNKLINTQYCRCPGRINKGKISCIACLWSKQQNKPAKKCGVAIGFYQFVGLTNGPTGIFQEYFQRGINTAPDALEKSDRIVHSSIQCLDSLT